VRKETIEERRDKTDKREGSVEKREKRRDK
jgi:hypothetical protein